MASLNYNLGFALETKDKGFKYKDINVPFEKDNPNFEFKDLKDINAVNNSLYNLFSWFKGERVLKPEYGNPLYPYLYEGINETTTQNLRNAIKSALKIWEPRVKVEIVDVKPNEDHNEYNIQLVYSIPPLEEYNKNFTYNVSVTT